MNWHVLLIVQKLATNCISGAGFMLRIGFFLLRCNFILNYTLGVVTLRGLVKLLLLFISPVIKIHFLYIICCQDDRHQIANQSSWLWVILWQQSSGSCLLTQKCAIKEVWASSIHLQFQFDVIPPSSSQSTKQTFLRGFTPEVLYAFVISSIFMTCIHRILSFVLTPSRSVNLFFNENFILDVHC